MCTLTMLTVRPSPLILTRRFTSPAAYWNDQKKPQKSVREDVCYVASTGMKILRSQCPRTFSVLIYQGIIQDVDINILSLSLSSGPRISSQIISRERERERERENIKMDICYFGMYFFDMTSAMLVCVLICQKRPTNMPKEAH